MNDDRPTNVNWTRRPNPEDTPLDWHIASVPAKGLKNATILTPDVTGAYVHFTRGRTRPCQGDKCNTCADGAKPRWEGYVAITDRRMTSRLILRLTPAAMRAIDAYYREHRTLRGATLSLERRDNKANGKLFAVITEGITKREHLPKPPNMHALLSTVWGLHTNATPAHQPAPRIAPETAHEKDFGDEAREA